MADAGGWSTLPADLLREVSGRLSSDADHLHIHQVCPHWRASTVPPATYRPWVLAGRAGRSGLLPIGDYSLRLPRRGEQRMDIGAPPSSLPFCCGASRGWLALADDDRSPTRLALWEPLSNTEIPLPCPSPLTRIYLSDDPLSSSNWIAIASRLEGVLGQKTLLWRPGDAAWTMLNDRGTPEILTIAFHEGKAYYVDQRQYVIICDLNAGTGPSPKCITICNAAFLLDEHCRSRCGTLHPMCCLHLVACNGELLLVVLRRGKHPSPVEVYKPVWTPENCLEIRERVMDLGDHSLFVGRGDTFALSAKEFPAIKRNCVYYVHGPYKNHCWTSVFHLESDFWEDIPYSEEFKQDPTGLTRYVWFCIRRPLIKQQ